MAVVAHHFLIINPWLSSRNDELFLSQIKKRSWILQGCEKDAELPVFILYM